MFEQMYAYEVVGGTFHRVVVVVDFPGRYECDSPHKG